MGTKQETRDRVAGELDGLDLHELFRDINWDNDTDMADAAINLIGEMEAWARGGRCPAYMRGRGDHRRAKAFLAIVEAWCDHHRADYEWARAELIDGAEG
jgi:hypothetical protein